MELVSLQKEGAQGLMEAGVSLQTHSPLALEDQGLEPGTSQHTNDEVGGQVDNM